MERTGREVSEVVDIFVGIVADIVYDMPLKTGFCSRPVKKHVRDVLVRFKKCPEVIRNLGIAGDAGVQAAFPRA